VFQFAREEPPVSQPGQGVTPGLLGELVLFSFSIGDVENGSDQADYRPNLSIDRRILGVNELLGPSGVRMRKSRR